MKKQFTLLFFILLTLEIQSQVYFVAFKDKNTADTSQAYATLSERAISRRMNQEVSIDSLDFPVKTTYKDSILTFNIELKHTSKWLNGLLIRAEKTETIDSINSIDFVTYIHDLSATSTGGAMGNLADTLLYGQTTETTDFLELDYFHKQGLLGQGLMISFFDAGFPGIDTLKVFKHLFRDNLIKDTYNVIDGNKEVFKSDEHGTNVASIVLAIDSGKFIGASPRADVAFYITEDIASETLEEEYNWVIGAEKADSAGTDIINSSLGYVGFDSEISSHTFSELDGKTAVISKGAKIASSKGILVVNSAGNSGNSRSWPFVGFPADVEEVLTVGAINSTGERAGFSSFGSNTPYQKPEIVAPGTSIDIVKANGSYRKSSGTSFSAPLVSAYAALLWQQEGDLSSQEIKQEIINLGSNLEEPTAEIGYGYPRLTINSIDNKDKQIEIVTEEYYNLKGIKIEEISHSGIYILKTTYSNNSVSRKKVSFYK